MKKIYSRKDHNTIVRIILVGLLGGLLMCVSGCSTYGMNYYKRPEVDIRAVRKIAVLPFESLVSDVYAGERIRRLVINDLLTRGIDVIEPGEVTWLINSLGNGYRATVNSQAIKQIGEKLGVDAVMLGSVEVYKISTGVTATYPEVSISMRMLETASSSIVWSVENTSGGAGFMTRHFGTEGMTLSQAARKVVKKALNTLF